MGHIQIRQPHVDSDAAMADVRAVLSQTADLQDCREIEPATAVTIASWWQSSGRIGSVLAGFASGAAVERTELLDDISRSRATAGYIRDDDSRALDCLATFVINYPGD